MTSPRAVAGPAVVAAPEVAGAEVQDALRRASATIRDLRARLSGAHVPLAVVAASCRLPGGVRSPQDYWRVLLSAAPVVDEVPAWRWAGRPPVVGGGAFAGTVDDVELFDPGFFGIGAAEARAMDPQQRLMLALSYEAVERWGRLPADLVGSDTGVFVGVGHQDYLTAMLSAGAALSGFVGPGNARSLVANRVSYGLGLRGPSLVVDTACSSSLVAVHLAAQALRAHECSAAVVGGVNLILAPESTVVTGRALPLAPDGRTKTFDAAADGMVRGEGAAVLVLRRLPDALADGDHVHAVLHGTGVNQDGRTNGLTAPSPVAQELLLASVLARSGLRPEQVGYVETHGTGTPLGDPIEVEAVRGAYGDGSSTCWLGSVKPVLGHLESAAGIASLLKAVLAVEHGVVPAQASLGRVNPEVRLDGTRFRLPRKAVTWDEEDRFAAVSSFGFGGTNAHVVLGRAPGDADATAAVAGSGRAVLVPVSGHTPQALTLQLTRLAATVGRPGSPPAAATAAALARRRTHRAYRCGVVVEAGTGDTPAAADLATALTALADPATRRAPRVAMDGLTALVIGGQGTSWSPRLLADPEVVAELSAWDEESRAAGGPPVAGVLTPLATAQAMPPDTLRRQLALAVIQAAMANGLVARGLVPDLVLGHSLGEVVAALLAGRLTRAEAVRLVHARAAAQEAVKGGSMAAVDADLDQVQHLLARHGDDRVGVAAVNSPGCVVVAGPGQALRSMLAAGGLRHRLLDTDHAFHSPVLAGTAPPGTLVAGIGGAAALRTISSVTGRLDPDGALPRDHWWRNVTEPVQFADAVVAALGAGVRRFLEIAPRTALAQHVERTAAAVGADVVVVGSGPRAVSCRRRLDDAVARAWEAGAVVDWRRLHPVSPVLPGLPPSALDESRHWFADPAPAAAPTAGPVDPAAVGAEVASADPAGADVDELVTWVREVVAEVAGFASADEVDAQRPATELDVDSAELVEVKNRLEDRLGIAVPVTLLLEGASLTQVVATLVATTSVGPGSVATHGGDLLAGRAIEDLSEDEVDELLADLARAALVLDDGPAR